MLERLSPFIPRVRRAVRRRRRMLMMLLIGGLAALIVPGMLPAPMQTADVIVTDRALGRGSVLTEEDLRTQRVALPLRPEGSVAAPRDAAGIRLPRDLAAGEVVVPGALEASEDDPELTGMALMSVPADPELVPRLSPGDNLHLIVSLPEHTSSSRIDAVVLDVPSASVDPGLGGVSSSGHGTSILVAVQPSRSGEIAHALHEGWLSVTLIG